MRITPLATIAAALVTVLVVGAVAYFVLQPPRALLTGVTVAPNVITPNGDGDSDATQIVYTLNRPARITVTFTNDATKQSYPFRQNELRGPDTYKVLFNGLVKGYTLPDEKDTGDILARLIPNGDYTWSVSALGEDGSKGEASGKLTLQKGDPALPLIQGFDVSPAIFTPNQDGVDDRVTVNAYLTKKADLSVYLLDADNRRYDLPERLELRDPGQPGAHAFDYDGGLDNLVSPPPNGDYTLVAETEDAAGQRIRRTSKLTIKDGGLPQVEIQPQTTGAQVYYETQPYSATMAPEPKGVLATDARISVRQNDMLIFRLTVSNYGNTPLRTLAPWPGTTYQWDDLYYGKLDPKISRSGVWMVGLSCDTSATTFPYRWAIGAPDQLSKVTDNEGQTFYYLLPGQKATVWGAVQMSKLVLSRNPTECWAGLIHEDKEIPALQSHVGAIKVQIMGQ